MELSPEVRGEKLEQEFEVPARGWQRFSDVVWELLYLDEGDYTVTIHFLDGNVNLCSVSIKDSTTRYHVWVPETVNALHYYDYTELDPERQGDVEECPGPLDAQLCRDDTGKCQETGPCNLAFMEAGEKAFYQLSTDGRDATVDITFRAASFSNQKKFRVEILVGGWGGEKRTKTFSGPGRGYHRYEDLVWKDVHLGTQQYHEMTVIFEDGQVNLCSFTVEYV